MAYLVSQIRKGSEKEQYMKKLKVQETFFYSKNPFGQDRVFKDYAIQIQGNNQFKRGVTYYLRFKVARIPKHYYSSDTSLKCYNPSYEQADVLNLTLFLSVLDEEDKQIIKEDSEVEGNETQTIGTCYVPMIVNNKEQQAYYSTFSFVFTPIKNFNYLVFKIQRNNYDAIEKTIDEQDGAIKGMGGRTWLIENQEDDSMEEVYRNESNTPYAEEKLKLFIPKHRIFVDYPEDATLNEALMKGQLCELVNIVKNSKSKTWLKMGYQSRPGALIVVNQQPIRVGRSGIYELNNGMQIKSFMIASPGGATEQNASVDAFLLAYAYQTE